MAISKKKSYFKFVGSQHTCSKKGELKGAGKTFEYCGCKYNLKIITDSRCARIKLIVHRCDSIKMNVKIVNEKKRKAEWKNGGKTFSFSSFFLNVICGFISNTFNEGIITKAFIFYNRKIFSSVQ